LKPHRIEDKEIKSSGQGLAGAGTEKGRIIAENTMDPAVAQRKWTQERF
jgi:hypothetical protein